MTPKEIREKQAELAKKIKALNDKVTGEKRSFNAEERAEWDRMNGEFDALEERCEDAVNAERARNFLEEPADNPRRRGLESAADFDSRSREGQAGSRNGSGDQPTEEDYLLAIQGWMCRSAERPEWITKRHMDAVRRTGLNLNAMEVRMRMSKDAPGQREFVQNLAGKYEYRTQSIIDGAAHGAVTVPVTLLRRLEMAVLASNGIRKVAEIIRTDTGEDLEWLTVDDTEVSGHIITEKGPIGAVVDIGNAGGGGGGGFAKQTWGSHIYSSHPIKATEKILRDSIFDLAEKIADLGGKRVGRQQNTDMTVGDGIGKPVGLLNATGGAQDSGIVVSAANWANLLSPNAPDALLDLMYGLDEEWAANFSYMCHRTTLGHMRKMKDANGQYLWDRSLVPGEPQTFNGAPVFTNTDFPMATGTGKLVTGGDHSMVKIRDVGDIRIRRNDSLYWEELSVGFMVVMESDSKVLLAGGAPPIEFLTVS